MTSQQLSAAGRRRGISLIESILYLVVSLAVVIGGITFFQQAQLQSRTNDAIQSAHALVTQIRASYENQDYYGADDISDIMARGKYVTPNMVNENGDGLVHPWGGAMHVYGNQKNFAISLEDLPEAACRRLAHVQMDGISPMGEDIYGITFINRTVEGRVPDFSTSTPGNMTKPDTYAPVQIEDTDFCIEPVDVYFFYLG